MKRRIIIVISSLLLISTAWYNGMFERHNFITAYIDAWRGNYKMVYYGESDPSDSNKQMVAKSMGFEYKRIAGCNVTVPLVTGASHYNGVMKNYLIQKYGNTFRNQF